MLTEIEAFVNWLRRRSPQARTWRDYHGWTGCRRHAPDRNRSSLGCPSANPAGGQAGRPGAVRQSHAPLGKAK